MDAKTKAEMKAKIKHIASYWNITSEFVLQRAIEKYYNHFLMTISRKMPIVRSNLLQQQKHECYYCHRYLSHTNVTLDHKQPIARGGTNEIENLVAACLPCNNDKGVMTEEEFKSFQTQEEI